MIILMCISLIIVCVLVVCLITNFNPRLFEWPVMLYTHNSNHKVLSSKQIFKIVQFTDLHFGEGVDLDNQTINLMQYIMIQEQPDFVVFSGDQISGHAVPSLHVYKDLLQQVLNIPAMYNTPFATIYGNHDDQPYHCATLMWHEVVTYAIYVMSGVYFITVILGMHTNFQFCKKYPNYLVKCTINILFISLLAALCTLVIIMAPTHIYRSLLLFYELELFPLLSYSQQGPLDVHGVSNYHILIEGPTSSMTLLFLDTGGGRIPEYIHDDQKSWLTKTHTQYPSLAFMHIPTETFQELYHPVHCTGPPPMQTPESCSNSKDVIATLYGLGTVAVFVGHDHDNAWCCLYENMNVCYGKHSGFAGYNKSPERGARIISVDMLNQSHLVLDTWIHMYPNKTYT